MNKRQQKRRGSSCHARKWLFKGGRAFQAKEFYENFADTKQQRQGVRDGSTDGTTGGGGRSEREPQH